MIVITCQPLCRSLFHVGNSRPTPVGYWIQFGLLKPASVILAPMALYGRGETRSQHAKHAAPHNPCRMAAKKRPMAKTIGLKFKALPQY